MKTRISDDQRRTIYEMLDAGASRDAISVKAGLTPGQVSAVAAHRTMRANESRARTSALVAPASREKAFGTTKENSSVGTFAIPLGHDSSDNLISWDPSKASNPHVLVVGESGSGKTYTVSRLAIELANRGVPSIVFDYGQGFALTSEAAVLDEDNLLKKLDLGAHGISVNPLEIFSSDLLGPLTVAQRVADTFLRVYPKLGVQQHSLLRKAVLDLFSDCGIAGDDKQSWTRRAPSFKELESKIREIEKEGTSSERRAATTLASHISTIFFFDTFRRSGLTLGWSDLLQNGHQLWILKLNGLEDSVEKAVTEFLLWNLLRFFESIGPGPLRCYIVLDEAHRLAMSEGSPVERLLREGRKFGIGVILASQQPEDFTSVAYTNTATKLAFQLFDTNGRVVKQLRQRALEGMSGEKLLKAVSTLPRGSAYVVTSQSSAIVDLFSYEEARAHSAATNQRKSR